MKKYLALILTAIMLISISACSANEGELILTTGGTGGSYYPYGGAMATIFTDNIADISVTSTASGASTENARLLNSKEADLAILQNDVLDYAFNGTEVFKDEGSALTNLATIATLYPEVIQIVVTADSGISSINDLKGKNISVGAAGSGTEANARQILEAYGITYNDFGKVEYLSFAESSTAVQNMTLDGFFCTAGVPNPSILELNTARKIIILSIDADKADALIAKYPFYAKYDIGEGVYEGIGGASTVAVMATLACRKDLSTDTVYNITKTLFEKQADLAAANDKASTLDVNTAINGVSVPLHPGAEKYYKEVGVIK
ncbi:MAG: TAXI family TRAP transporter solute-binding subunit [Eubacteriales bacterium]